MSSPESPPTPPPPPSLPSAAATAPVPATAVSVNGTNSTTPTPLPVTPVSMSRNGLPPGAVAGLTVGIVIGSSLVLFLACICAIYRRRRRRKKYGLAGHPGVLPQGTKDESSAGLPQNFQHNVGPPKDKVSTWPNPTPPPGISPLAQSSIQRPTPPEIPPSPGSGLGFSQSSFLYEELENATNGFSSANLIGEGGYGYVHKGVLSNGKVVAVKQLKAESSQGEREFQAEVEIIGRIHHRHLVSLVGYCIAGAQRMLVYEYVPNNTLEFHLHGKERPTMSWPTRMRIAIGSARGLAYLHEDCQPKVIHRDIKASNILLDFGFEAKVADFGLAKISEDTDTHVSTRVMGTFGYLAPEYALSGKLSEKSDVFSFGVVLLELITGRRPIDKAHPFAEDSMVDWARPLLSQALDGNNVDALIDPRLHNDYDSGEMARMVACAAASVRHSARERPKMSQIVRALEGNLALDDLNEGILPGHVPYGRGFIHFGSSDYDTSQYQEDLKKFRKLALESQEQTTSEFSGLTSEFGVQPSTSSSEDPPSTKGRNLET